jgi:hypothetical protein
MCKITCYDFRATTGESTKMRQSYSEFLRGVEGVISFLALCEPAHLSPKSNTELFVGRVITALECLLAGPPDSATELEAAQTKRLQDRVRQLQEYHLKIPF